MSTQSNEDPNRYHRQPKRFWYSTQNRRECLDWLGPQLGVHKLEDWYNVHIEDVEERSGFLLNIFGKSLGGALQSIYPETKWQLWRFHPAPKGYFKNNNNVKAMVHWLADRLGIQKNEDWYTISLRKIEKEIHPSIIKRFGGLGQMLTQVYSDYPWELKKFSEQRSRAKFEPQEVEPRFLTKTQKGALLQKESFKAVLETIAKQLNVGDMEDWYRVSILDIHRLGGTELLATYQYSLHKALATIYPEHKWKIWKFSHTTRGYWEEEAHHKEFFEWLGGQLNVKKMEDWYRVTLNDIANLGGSAIMRNYYANSPAKAVAAMYPEVNWQSWRFLQIPKGFWDSMENVRLFADFLAREYGINKPEDWYKVTPDMVCKHGGSVLLVMYGGLPKILEKVYPDFPWDWSKSAASKKQIQARLREVIHELFPKQELEVDVQKSSLALEKSGKLMQLDVYIQELHIAFEYQAEDQFSSVSLEYNTLKQPIRDEEKRRACYELGITLIEIPFWSDFSKESIVTSIYHVRPDLAQLLRQTAPEVQILRDPFAKKL